MFKNLQVLKLYIIKCYINYCIYYWFTLQLVYRLRYFANMLDLPKQ